MESTLAREFLNTQGAAQKKISLYSAISPTCLMVAPSPNVLTLVSISRTSLKNPGSHRPGGAPSGFWQAPPPAPGSRALLAWKEARSCAGLSHLGSALRTGARLPCTAQEQTRERLPPDRSASLRVLLPGAQKAGGSSWMGRGHPRRPGAWRAAPAGYPLASGPISAKYPLSYENFPEKPDFSIKFFRSC